MEEEQSAVVKFFVEEAKMDTTKLDDVSTNYDCMLICCLKNETYDMLSSFMFCY